jgi:hypothetical protein
LKWQTPRYVQVAREALAPAVAQPEAEDGVAALGTEDGADDHYLGAQCEQARRFILHHLAFEIRYEVEQEADLAGRAASVP